MRKPCCVEENLEVKDSERPDLELKVCKICSCRHFILHLDPGHLGVLGKGI